MVLTCRLSKTEKQTCVFCGFFYGDRYWQPAVTSESSLETAGCLQRTFAGDSQLKYIDGIWTNKINN